MTEPAEFDQVASASDPIRIGVSHARIKRGYPAYFRIFFWKKVFGRTGKEWLERIEEHMLLGDSRAAVVVSTSPFLVAAYTDEIDCVAILKFPGRVVRRHSLSVGSRLLTVNTYSILPKVVSDLIPGPQDTNRWQNFSPVIADFVSDDRQQIQTRKTQIHESEWQRTFELGEAYRRDRPDYIRDGCPFRCAIPGTPMHLVEQASSLAGMPDFSVTKHAADTIREVVAAHEMPRDGLALLLTATNQHPDVFERKMGFTNLDRLDESRHFYITSEGLTFAVSKDHAHAFNGCRLGFSESPRGFVFHSS